MGPMNRGYAFGFLIVLLVAVLGLYVAFTGFVSSRDALRAQLASQTSTPVVQITPDSSGALPTAAVTVVFIPTSAYTNPQANKAARRRANIGADCPPPTADASACACLSIPPGRAGCG
jgi:hypothetical protein